LKDLIGKEDPAIMMSEKNINPATRWRKQTENPAIVMAGLTKKMEKGCG